MQYLIGSPPDNISFVGLHMGYPIIILMQLMHLSGLQPGDWEGGMRCGDYLQVGEMLQKHRDEPALPSRMQMVLNFVDEEDRCLVFPAFP